MEALKNTLNQEIEGETLFSKVFQHSPIGLMIVDADTNLYKVNKFMFRYFDREYQEAAGQKFGNIFQCSVVYDSDMRCGTAQACKNCALRNGVLSVLEQGVTIESVDLFHDFTLNGRSETKCFTVSATPVYYDEQKYALVSFVDITKHIEMEQQLHKLGITDGLTGLYNQRHVIGLLNDALLHGTTPKICVCFMDIDDFKDVNDQYGHLVGDEILKLLAAALKKQLRHYDIAGRYGGEEFIVFFTDTAIEDAARIIKRVLVSFSELSKTILNEPVTFSCGLVEVPLAKKKPDCRDILKAADAMLYEAKSAGKNCIKLKQL